MSISFKVANVYEIYRKPSFAAQKSWNWGSNKYTWYSDKDLRDNITYKIIDNNGKVYLWSTQCDKPQVNAVYTASIKREQDYKGEHQIVITRAKLIEKAQDNERVIVRAIQSGGAIWDDYEEQFVFNSREEYYEWLEENEDCWTFIWEED